MPTINWWRVCGVWKDSVCIWGRAFVNIYEYFWKFWLANEKRLNLKKSVVMPNHDLTSTDLCTTLDNVRFLKLDR